jgi:hypothetical protein
VTAPVHRSLILLLALASVAAVFAIHRIEHAGSPVGKPSVTPFFSPNGDRRDEVAELRFALQKSGRTSVWIENSHGHRVRWLARHVQMHKGTVRIHWDGRNDAGRVVPDGRYTPVLRLDSTGRTFRLHQPTQLDTTAPKVVSIKLLHHTSHDPVGTFSFRAVESGGVRTHHLVMGIRTFPKVVSVSRPRSLGHGDQYEITVVVRTPAPSVLKADPRLELVAIDPAGNVGRGGLRLGLDFAADAGNSTLTSALPKTLPRSVFQ